MIENQNKHKREFTWFIIYLILVVLVFVFGLRQIRKSTQNQVQDSLISVLNSTQEALHLWLNQRLNSLSELSKHPQIIESTEKLLALPRNKKALLNNDEIVKLRKFMAPILELNQDRGIFIISPDSISLASMRDANTGTKNLIPRNHKKKFESLFAGNIELIPPMKSEVPLRNKEGLLMRNYSTMFFAFPIIKDTEAIAVFTIRIDPNQNFNRIIKNARIGESGETYAFDRHGTLLSESRFEKQLKELGILKNSQTSETRVKISTPFQNELTYMAQHAINGNSGANIDGYKDYRGELVVGAWVWDEKLGIGLTTEMDKNEAFKNLFILRSIFIITFLLIVSFAFFLLYKIINQRKKTELRLIQLNEKLEIKVKERTKELEKSNATKDRFFSIIAHDLRNPIASILGISEILKVNFHELEKERKLNMSEMIHQGTTHVYKLLENLLEWSSSQIGSVNIKPEKFSIIELFNTLIELNSQMTQEKHIRMSLINITDAKAFADKNMISTILRNLISNAVKFTPNHGEVILSFETKEHAIHIHVEDTGVGIPEKVLKNLFKIDEKVSTRGTNNERGTGLGLILCKEFVQLNGGEIWVKSELNKGSRFSFSIPTA